MSNSIFGEGIDEMYRKYAVKRGIRNIAKQWLHDNHPELANNKMHASKYCEDKDEWFFTFSTDYFSVAHADNDLIMLLQQKFNKNEFHLLKVPFSFFRENKLKFNIRRDSAKFDLHISAKRKSYNKWKWLEDERSGVSFKNFEVKTDK